MKDPNKTQTYTASFDHAYTQFAGIYDLAVKALPVWKSWLKQALPYIRGPHVLEVSFGTGYLLTQYAAGHTCFGIDYNRRMAAIASRNLARAGLQASVQVADVAALPYPDESFDTLVNTMSFTGYPDGLAAMSELYRVLKPGGRLVLIDINYPADRNPLGTALTRMFATLGDIIRPMAPLFERFNLRYQDLEIGGFGSVHLYLGEKT
jgi:ubiquinone/menaquinone biosynthesis C-methylase UbiE